jgi:hypothetical protein
MQAAQLFSNCPLVATPDMLLSNHAVAARVAVQTLLDGGLKTYLPDSLDNPTDVQLTDARRTMKAAEVKGCSQSGLAADCPVSDCATLTNETQRNHCTSIAKVNQQAKAWLEKLRNPSQRVGYCGAWAIDLGF